MESPFRATIGWLANVTDSVLILTRVYQLLAHVSIRLIGLVSCCRPGVDRSREHGWSHLTPRAWCGVRSSPFPGAPGAPYSSTGHWSGRRAFGTYSAVDVRYRIQ